MRLNESMDLWQNRERKGRYAVKKNKKGRMAHLREAEQKSVGLERQVAELKQRAEKAEYELGRYMRAVHTREKIIADLREQLKVEDLKQRSNEALVALLLCRMGADKDNPVVVAHEAVREALNGYHVLVQVDDEKGNYSLCFIMEPVEAAK